MNENSEFCIEYNFSSPKNLPFASFAGHSLFQERNFVLTAAVGLLSSGASLQVQAVGTAGTDGRTSITNDDAPSTASMTVGINAGVADLAAGAGTALDRDAALIEAGFELDFHRGARLDLNYQGDLDARAQNHGFNARLAGKF